MEAGNYDTASAYGYGEKIAEQIGLSEKSDLSEVAYNLNGGEIHHIDFTTFCKMKDVYRYSIYVHENAKFDVAVPAYITSDEMRYTLAHELGHFVLHSGNGKCYATRGGNDEVEQQADCFALGFLLPEKNSRKNSNTLKTWKNWQLFFEFLL